MRYEIWLDKEAVKALHDETCRLLRDMEDKDNV